MNEKQQELYEKLLKKVNEFCLGQAAEDVIAAIDALVENYERHLQPNKKHLSIVKLLGKPTLQDALTTIYNSQDIMGGYNDFWEAYRMIETAIKALEVIKTKGLLWDIDYQPYKEVGDYRAWDNEFYQSIELTKEEYELLKEVFTNESTN